MLRRTLPVVDFYRFTWQLLILVDGALAVISQVARPLVSIPFFLIAFTLMTRFGANLGHRRKQLAYGIGLALFLLAVEQVLRITAFEDLVSMLFEMICGSLPLILINHERPRSYWLALLNAVVIGVGSITFMSNAAVYLGFLLLIVLMLFNLNAANLYLPDAEGRTQRDDLPSGYFRQFLYVLPVGLASAVVIFLAFPRVQSFTMTLGRMLGHAKTGYSGLVTLTGDGEMANSEVLAFIVESSDKTWLRQAGPDLHFRGDALDTFDGTKWTPTVFNYRQKDHSYDLRVATRHGDSMRELTMHLEPAPTTAVFYPGILVSVLGPSPGVDQFLFNANGSIVRNTVSFDRFNYTLRTVDPVSLSDLPPVSLKSLRTSIKTVDTATLSPATMTPHDVDTYLAVPPKVQSAPWFQAWLAELAIDAENGTLANTEARLSQVFQKSFKPTLANTFTGENALASFLTTDRQGHCEYFATASALTLRALGVPARIVVGYHGGTYNNLIDALEVREEDAHAWVEAFVPGVGWLPFDPTPASPRGPGEGGFAATLRLYTNAVGFWFREYVVDYDQSTQRDLLHSLRDIGGKSRADQRAWRNLALGYGKPAGLLGLGIIGLWWVTRRLRRRGSGPALPSYYLAFLRLMARRGLNRQTGETFGQFHQRLTGAGIDAQVVAELDEALAEDLYAPGGWRSKEQRAELRRRITGMMRG